MILYPTETIYALGVNVLDPVELEDLYMLKGRAQGKQVSWLVRDIADIECYAVLSDMGAKIATRFLPGPLTLVLPLRKEVIEQYQLAGETVGFRISSDPLARKLIHDFMAEHDAPLTCTSANVSGMETGTTPHKILAQFGERAEMIDTVIDDGARMGTPSSVVRVVGEKVEVLREDAVTRDNLLEFL